MRTFRLTNDSRATVGTGMTPLHSVGAREALFSKAKLGMAQIICVTSQKGGVGKTTTAVNLSTAFALAEKASLLVDCDPQGNATTGMGIDKSKLRGSLYDVMVGHMQTEEGLVQSKLKGLMMLPSRSELFQVERELREKEDKEGYLKQVLRGLRKAYDYIIIDTPPSLGLLTVNAVVASDLLLIPLQCEFYALEGIRHQLRMIHDLKRRFNRGLQIAGILLTMVEAGEPICDQIAKTARSHFKDMVLQTLIPRDISLRESASHGKPLLLKDLTAVGSQRYFDLARELMARYPCTNGEGALH